MSDKAKLNFLKMREGACLECGAVHRTESPHKWGNDFYMQKFFDDHGVFPSWGDALAHCREDVRNNWRGILCEAGYSAEDFVPNKPETTE